MTWAKTLDTRFLGGYILSVGFGVHLQLYSDCPPVLTRTQAAVPVRLVLAPWNRLGHHRPATNN